MGTYLLHAAKPYIKRWVGRGKSSSDMPMTDPTKRLGRYAIETEDRNFCNF